VESKRFFKRIQTEQGNRLGTEYGETVAFYGELLKAAGALLLATEGAF
jgi:hypothetical protein